MRHTEALEGRRHFAGVQAAFAFGDGITVGDATVGGAGTTYVEVSSGRYTYVAKLTPKLKLDAAWGDGGFAPVGFNNVARLAYDAKSGVVYAGGVSDYAFNAPLTLTLQRFTSGGEIDTTYGGGTGLATYTTAAKFVGEGDGPQLSLQALLPLPKGRLLVGMTRGVKTSNGLYNDDTNYDSTVMRLRYDGSRDPTFGDCGYSVQLGGYSASRGGESNYANYHKRSAITDLKANRDGTYAVLLRREEGETRQGISDNNPIENADVYIKARTLSADGVIDPTTAKSWVLVRRGTASDENHGFAPVYSGFSGDRIIAVGTPTLNCKYRTRLIFSMANGRKVTSGVAPSVSGYYVDELKRDAAGQFYGFALGRVGKFDTDFKAVKTWGIDGIVESDDLDAVYFVPNEAGQVAMIDSTGHVQLAG